LATIIRLLLLLLLSNLLYYIGDQEKIATFQLPI